MPARGRAKDGCRAAPVLSTHLTGPIAAGDAGAFGAFYEIWFDRALAMARAITRRDESFCLDIVQDCMLRVVRSMRPLASEAAVQAWMARAITTTALDRLRQERRRVRRERAAAASERDDTAATELEQNERLEWLRQRLAELPAADRRLLVERFGRGRTLDGVGAVLGITGDAVHGRIRRLVRRLRAVRRGVLDD